MTATCAVLLAAGGGSRFGRPKALVKVDGVPLVVRAVHTLTEGGCDPVLAVVGAQSREAIELLPRDAVPVVAEHWEAGVAASVRAGIEAASALTPQPDAVLIHLVDLPDVGSAVVARLLAHASPDALARATFRGAPGHPVLLGRSHWRALLGALHGDRGAGPWLRGREDLRLIECADLATGADVDTPDALRNLGPLP